MIGAAFAAVVEAADFGATAIAAAGATTDGADPAGVSTAVDAASVEETAGGMTVADATGCVCPAGIVVTVDRVDSAGCRLCGSVKPDCRDGS